MKVRLTKKYAEQIDGVDLAARKVGDILDLSAEKARLLLAEQWAMPAGRELDRRELSDRRAVRFSADDFHRRLKEKLSELESDRRNTHRRQDDLRD